MYSTSMKNHVRKCYKDKKFICNHCDAIFYRPDELEDHVLIHGERKIKCGGCDRKFHQRQGFNAHDCGNKIRINL